MFRSCLSGLWVYCTCGVFDVSNFFLLMFDSVLLKSSEVFCSELNVSFVLFIAGLCIAPSMGTYGFKVLVR